MTAAKRTIRLDQLKERTQDALPVSWDVSGITSSIRADGFNQNEALDVVPDTINGGFTILDGVKRARAAREAGVNELPCRVHESASAFSEMVSVHGNPATTERLRAMTYSSNRR
jgi:ParB-like chromosome segregation protein Spo0J